MFWAERHGDASPTWSLHRADADGAGAVALAVRTLEIRRIAIDAERVLWVEQGTSTATVFAMSRTAEVGPVRAVAE
jgi:hypothetical protein